MNMIVAADIGFSAVKVLSNRDGKSIFPSVVGTPIPEGSFSFKRNQKALSITGNGHYTPVGETALNHSNYVSGRLDREWVLSQDWKTLLLTALSEVTTAPYSRVSIVVGLPVSDWNRYEKDVYDYLKQTFNFKRLERNMQHVEVIHAAVITQVYGSLFDQIIDKNGALLSNAWSDGRVGCLDIGGNTMNIASVLPGLEEIENETKSYPFGLLRALDEVRLAIGNSFPNFSPELHEVSEWLAIGTFRYRGQDHDIWPYAEPYLMPLIDRIITKVNDTLPESGRFDALLISGGGAATLGKYIKSSLSKQFANIAIAEDPRWANVRGYLKYGLREFANV